MPGKEPQVPPLRFAPVGMTILVEMPRELLVEVLRELWKCSETCGNASRIHCGLPGNDPPQEESRSIALRPYFWRLISDDLLGDLLAD